MATGPPYKPSLKEGNVRVSIAINGISMEMETGMIQMNTSEMPMEMLFLLPCISTFNIQILL